MLIVFTTSVEVTCPEENMCPRKQHQQLVLVKNWSKEKHQGCSDLGWPVSDVTVLGNRCPSWMGQLRGGPAVPQERKRFNNGSLYQSSWHPATLSWSEVNLQLIRKWVLAVREVKINLSPSQPLVVLLIHLLSSSALHSPPPLCLCFFSSWPTSETAWGTQRLWWRWF